MLSRCRVLHILRGCKIHVKRVVAYESRRGRLRGAILAIFRIVDAPVATDGEEVRYLFRFILEQI